MAEQLKNTLAFNLAPGATVVLPHGLQTSLGVRLAPDIIFVPSPDLKVLSDDVSVTLSNAGTDPVAGDVLVESWHTIERAFGDEANKNLPVKPYIVFSGDSSKTRNPMSPPEAWVANVLEVPASSIPMNPQVSTNFAEIQMIRDGSIVGAHARVINTLITGSITCTPTINGVPVAGLAATIGAGSDNATTTADAGIFPYLAGDKIGFVYDAPVDFAPTGSVEAWLEVFEQL